MLAIHYIFNENTPNSIDISTVSVFELSTPLRHRKLREQERVIKSFVHKLKTLPLDSIAVDESADIIGSLLRIGKPCESICLRTSHNGKYSQ